MGVPVVVVGNLYVGGTGKTPLAIELVRALQRRGWRPGVVSRGYGGTARSARLVDAEATATEVGDEPLLIARATQAPVAVGSRRVAAARQLLRAHSDCDVIVADDGLQHLRLARDVEIALVDERGLGNGWLLPAGPLREPASRLDTRGRRRPAGRSDGDLDGRRASRCRPAWPMKSIGSATAPTRCHLRNSRGGRRPVR